MPVRTSLVADEHSALREFLVFHQSAFFVMPWSY